MKKIFILLFIVIFNFPTILKSQYQTQYFDGNDTSIYNSIFIDYGSDTIGNIWQIGKPQKSIFNSASTAPNVLITDTINTYPNNDTSSFIIHLTNEELEWQWRGVFAFHWQQKLDIDTLYDGGLIEFSVDSGNTWYNIHESPYSYNLYGFESSSVDTLVNGEYVFTGIDTTWRNVWICFDYSWLYQKKVLDFKFTFISDAINNNKEGWIIDNFNAQTTFVHTLKELEQEEYIKIYPNPTKDRLHINIKRQSEYHIIEKLQVLSLTGEILDEFENVPTKFFLETNSYENGIYFLKIKTNLKTKTVKFTVEH